MEKRPVIKILFITHNRPGYARVSLERLCETVTENARVVVWDNASEPETVSIVKEYEAHPSVERVIYSPTNEKLWLPTNWFWGEYGDAGLLSKVDDDCLMPPRWCEVLSSAHAEVPEFGILGCWRFLPEDFNPANAAKKIRCYGTHQVMRNCWIEGSGYLMKRAVLEKNGPLRAKESFTTWGLRAAAAGFVNGWYYPFLYQEHMDDPRAEHTGIKTDEDFHSLAPLTARNFGITSRKAWEQRLRNSAQKLQMYSTNPYDFIGYWARLKRKACGLMGLQYIPRAKATKN
ncbi:MAG: glycosyltransferase family A protein [Deltaproteobacteria bacterium]|nr:glycosyltransferase family A protein [Deltaproteobacteria bacterium]